LSAEDCLNLDFMGLRRLTVIQGVRQALRGRETGAGAAWFSADAPNWLDPIRPAAITGRP